MNNFKALKIFLASAAFLFLAGIALLGLTCAEKEEPSKDETIIVPFLETDGDTLEVENGKEFWLDHVIIGGKNIYAVAAKLKYDSTAVKLVVEDGRVIYQDGGYLGVNSDLTVSLQSGRQGNVVVAYSKMGSQAGAQGSGTLWGLRFHAIRAGETQLEFDVAKSAVLSSRIVDGQQERLPAEFKNGMLEISAAIDTSMSTIILRVR